MLDIKYSQFFDSKAVIAKVDAGTRKALSKMGAFIRQRARSSMRSRRRAAQPDSPPSSHIGLLKRILFGYDDATKSVVVGPIKINTVTGKGNVPSLLEGGGVTTDWKGRTATYRKFPYMVPALEAEAPKFPDVFAGVVK